MLSDSSRLGAPSSFPRLLAGPLEILTSVLSVGVVGKKEQRVEGCTLNQVLLQVVSQTDSSLAR